MYTESDHFCHFLYFLTLYTKMKNDKNIINSERCQVDSCSHLKDQIELDIGAPLTFTAIYKGTSNPSHLAFKFNRQTAMIF